MRQTTGTEDIQLVSPAFPGGSLIDAVYDRNLMRLSDRGGASGMIGDRWAEICAAALREGTISLDRNGLKVERVIRLDDVPQIARAASRQNLQNPDFLLLGMAEGEPALEAADAKFSVETARSRQVSADVTAELLEIGPVVTDHVGALPEALNILDGVFLVPDYSLTHYVMRQRRGNRRMTVTPEEVILLPVTSQEFMASLEGLELVDILASIDGLPLRYEHSLLLGIYYFRLARACVACWLDQTRPLLGFKEQRDPDLEEMMVIARSLAADASSGWDVVMRWDELADGIRRQRTAVDHVASVPIGGQELRKQIEDAATAAGVEAPSVNQVRRKVGAWYRQVLLDEFGPMVPPVADFAETLSRLGRHARALRGDIPGQTTEVILELVTAAPPTPAG